MTYLKSCRNSRNILLFSEERFKEHLEKITENRYEIDVIKIENVLNKVRTPDINEIKVKELQIKLGISSPFRLPRAIAPAHACIRANRCSCSLLLTSISRALIIVLFHCYLNSTFDRNMVYPIFRSDVRFLSECSIQLRGSSFS